MTNSEKMLGAYHFRLERKKSLKKNSIFLKISKYGSQVRNFAS